METLAIKTKTAPTGQKRKASRLEKRTIRNFFLFVSPWLICFCLFGLVPMGASLYFSFTKYNIAKPPEWVGISNFGRIFADEAFTKAVGNTFYYTIIKVPMILALSLAAALLLNKRVRGKSVFRMLFYFPAVMPAVASIMVWVFIFNYEGGLLNMVVGGLNFPPFSWIFKGVLGDVPVQWFSTKNAMNSLLFMSLWGVGPGMVVFLAALQGVPKTYYEALEIDGGSSFKAFTHITLPMISPTIFYLLLTNLIAGLQVFAEMYLATGGGPNNATVSLCLLIYQYAFSTPIRMGLASALAWFVLVMTLILSFFTFKVSNKHTYYEGA